MTAAVRRTIQLNIFCFLVNEFISSKVWSWWAALPYNLFPLFSDEAGPIGVGFGEIAFGVGVEVVADAFAVLQQ